MSLLKSTVPTSERGRGEGQPILLSSRCGAENEGRYSENAKRTLMRSRSLLQCLFDYKKCKSTLITLSLVISASPPGQFLLRPFQIRHPFQFLRVKNKQVILQTVRLYKCSCMCLWNNTVRNN